MVNIRYNFQINHPIGRHPVITSMRSVILSIQIYKKSPKLSILGDNGQNTIQFSNKTPNWATSGDHQDPINNLLEWIVGTIKGYLRGLIRRLGNKLLFRKENNHLNV